MYAYDPKNQIVLWDVCEKTWTSPPSAITHTDTHSQLFSYLSVSKKHVYIANSGFFRSRH